MIKSITLTINGSRTITMPTNSRRGSFMVYRKCGWMSIHSFKDLWNLHVYDYYNPPLKTPPYKDMYKFNNQSEPHL
jgi:hypothetical protein